MGPTVLTHTLGQAGDALVEYLHVGRHFELLRLQLEKEGEGEGVEETA